MQDATEMIRTELLSSRSDKYFCSQVVQKVGYQLIWITLSKVDRLSLSDTGERVVVMKKELELVMITLVDHIQVVQYKGLTLALISIISHT